MINIMTLFNICFDLVFKKPISVYLTGKTGSCQNTCMRLALKYINGLIIISS